MKITIQNGKKGLFGGFADNGKAILVDRCFLNKVQEGETYSCTLKELDKCFIAINLKKVENGKLVVESGQLFAVSTSYKIPVKIIKTEDLGFFIQATHVAKGSRYYFNQTPEEVNLPTNVKWFTHIEKLENISELPIEELENLKNKYPFTEEGINQINKRIASIEKIEARKKQREEEKQFFYKEGYKVLLAHFNNCNAIAQVRKPIEDEIHSMVMQKSELVSEINNIANKFNIKQELVGGILPVDTFDAVLNYGDTVYRYENGEFKAGYYTYKKEIKYIPESEDGFRPEKHIEVDVAYFNEDNKTVPEELYAIPEKLKKIENLEKTIQQLENNLPKYPEVSEEVNKVFEIAFNIINEEVGEYYDTPNDIPKEFYMELLDKCQSNLGKKK
jgi:hypothetical protein